MKTSETSKRVDGSDGQLKNLIAVGNLAVTGFAVLRIGGSSLALNWHPCEFGSAMYLNLYAPMCDRQGGDWITSIRRQ